MKKGLFLIILFSIYFPGSAQFEQKVSINLSTGIFKTFGKKMGEYDPYQMPNYKAGFLAGGGLQFNLNRRFSLMAELGIMHSASWSYKGPDGGEYSYFSIYDAVNQELLLAEGYNELNLTNYVLVIRPKLYLLPGKKWNPFLFAGLSLNYTNAVYVDNYYYTAKRLSVLPVDYTKPYDPYLENNFGTGFCEGFGLEYSPNDKIGFYISGGHHFIVMDKGKFKNPHLEENFNAFLGQAGIRFSFLKSKKI